MANSLGNKIKLTIFGESHGPAIGGVLDGLPSGILIDEQKIQDRLKLRQGIASISTPRREEDQVEFLSGVFQQHSTGGAITFIIRNQNTISKDYSNIQFTPRPSHSDYPAYVKYHGFQDYRGGGQFSGRLTAVIVVAGTICQMVLDQHQIMVAAHLQQIGDLHDDPFDLEHIQQQIERLKDQDFPTINPQIRQPMIACIEDVRKHQDSIGGIVETAIVNVPVGLGEPLMDSFESQLAHGLFSIGAIKGIEFGLGFGYASQKGSQVNDAYHLDRRKIQTLSNHNGGIVGGMSNGMPIIFRCVVKPTPSIGLPQSSVNVQTLQETTLTIHGRHDPCIAHRARVVIEAMSSFVVLDLLLQGNV